MSYRETHPWITFELNLKAAPPDLWIALGEARSKCQHLAGIPLKPDMAAHLHQVYLAKGALATTAIEGNTLSEKEVLAIVQKKSELPQSQAYLEKEIQNILDGSNSILDKIESSGAVPITVNDIKEYNRQVLKGLEVEPYVVPGECVKTDIKVAGYHGAPWQECEALLKKLCSWLNGPQFGEWNGDKILTGTIKAIIAHLYLVWIHPFGDGNGRTARLLELRFLTEAGVPSAAGHLLSNFYNRTRAEYYRKLGEASKAEFGSIEFLKYATKGFVDELRQQLKVVKAQQWQVSWVNYIHESYEGHKSAADKRQLALILALSKQVNPISRSELRKISPDVAAEYAGKTDKTLTRDIHALEKRDLLARTKEGYYANSGKILAFLPRALKGSVVEQIKEIALTVEENGQLSLNF